ncbi:UNVERIFIED_CONTAM: hypothetical protein K2H54_003459, partial [Gekko kuhli]
IFLCSLPFRNKDFYIERKCLLSSEQRSIATSEYLTIFTNFPPLPTSISFHFFLIVTDIAPLASISHRKVLHSCPFPLGSGSDSILSFCDNLDMSIPPSYIGLDYK